MITPIQAIEYIFQIPLKWFSDIERALNMMRGDSGVSVDFSGDYPVIKLGDAFYQYRPIDCAKPTFTDGKLSKIEFYQVMAFCAVAKINSVEVTAGECT